MALLANLLLINVLACSSGATTSGLHVLNKLMPHGDFRTAEFEWSLSHLDGVDEGLVERHKTQIVDGSVLQFNFGDENALHEHRFHSFPSERLTLPPEDRMNFTPEELKEYTFPRELSAGTRSIFLRDGEVWQLDSIEQPTLGSTGKAEHSDLELPLDMSLLGLAPAYRTGASNPLHLSKSHYEGFESAHLENRFEGGGRVVIAAWRNHRLTWQFDDRRDRRPVRAMFVAEDGYVEYSETSLNQINGRWMPASVRFHRGEASKPYRLLEVSKSTFDEPWHKQALSPSDLGAVFGTYFYSYHEGSGGRHWDGGDLIASDDFWEMVYGFGILPDERIIKGLAQSAGKSIEQFINDQYRSPYADSVRRGLQRHYLDTYREEPPWITLKESKEKDPWDLYVDEFLKKHELPEPGVGRAKKFLEEAKKLRDANRHRIRKAERERDGKTIERYKEREERIYRERLVDPLDQLAATIAKENRDPKEDAVD